MTPILEGEGLRMAFGGVEVVRGVDISLLSGEVHAIIGENGAGKSTVAKILAGVYRPTGGTVRFDGVPVTMANPREALTRGIALIHQEPLTFPDLTVGENIFVGHAPTRSPIRQVDWSTMMQRADALLQSLGAKFDARAKAGGLSVADQQFVELACALAYDARVLLLDETTASLTPKEVDELFHVVRRLKGEGRALAFVSHRLDELFAISDRITVLRDGAKVGERRTAESHVPEIVQMMVGRALAQADPLPPAPAQEPILRVENLTDGRRFHEISLTVAPGEIVGLAGLVGSGRTEVCEAIFGVRPVIGGTVTFEDRAARFRSPREAIARGVAMVPEDRQHHGLLLSQSLSHNAVLPSIGRLGKRGFVRPKAERATAETQLRQLQTAFRTVNQPARELSGGNQQKVVLAKWLLVTPKLLILDEPTRGVDVGAKAEVHRLMRELAESGLAILMVSSDLSEVLAMSHRILVMREGRLVAEIPQAEATQERVMFAATGQEAHVA